MPGISAIPARNHLADTMTSENLQSILVSIQATLIASAMAVAVGTWAAPAARSALPKLRAILDAAYHVPVAVTSVVIGMAVLPGSPRCAAGGSESRRRSACGKESSDTCDSRCGCAPDGVAAHHRALAASLRADQAARLVAVWSPSSAGCRYNLWTWLWLAACISP